MNRREGLFNSRIQNVIPARVPQNTNVCTASRAGPHRKFELDIAAINRELLKGSLDLLLPVLLDIGLATFYLIVLAPCMLALETMIRLESHGPIFDRDQRIGRDGRLSGW